MATFRKWAGRTEVRILAEARIYLISQRSRPALWVTQALTKFHWRGKRQHWQNMVQEVVSLMFKGSAKCEVLSSSHTVLALIIHVVSCTNGSNRSWRTYQLSGVSGLTKQHGHKLHYTVWILEKWYVRVPARGQILTREERPTRTYSLNVTFGIL